MSAPRYHITAPHRELLGYLGPGLGSVTFDMDCSNQPGATTTMQIARLDEDPQTADHPSMVKIARHGAWGEGAGTVSNYILSFKSPLDWDGDSMHPACKDLDTARFIRNPLI